MKSNKKELIKQVKKTVNDEPNLLSKVETSPVTLTQLTHQSPYPYQFSLFTHQFSRIRSASTFSQCHISPFLFLLYFCLLFDLCLTTLVRASN